MAAESLFAFDALARQVIDPALVVVADENADNPDYAVSVLPAAPATRTRCLLTVMNRDPRKVHLAATLAIIESNQNTEVRVEKSTVTIENGQIHVIATLNWTDVSRESIETLARKFIGDFFRHVSQQGI